MERRIQSVAMKRKAKKKAGMHKMPGGKMMSDAQMKAMHKKKGMK